MSSSSDEDALLTALLMTLEDLHNIRNEMHACIKQGFLNMAKARKSLGRNSVSVLDTRGTHSAEVKINIASIGETGADFEGRTIFTRNGIPGVLNNAIGEVGFRQRGEAAGQQHNVKESRQPIGEKSLQGDSLSLFAGLVPPPLRKSKRNFSSAVDYAVEASTLMHRISCLQRQLDGRRRAPSHDG